MSAIIALDTLPLDCRNRIADLTERAYHSDTMRFTAEDSAELTAWQSYLDEIAESAS